MSVTIKKVVGLREWKSFVQFPYSLYARHKSWVPPLRISQEEILNRNNSFWKNNPNEFFLAYINGQVVGRIVAFMNRQHSNHFNSNDGFFGFLEAIDDAEVFAQLFHHAEEFLKSHQCNNIIGPMNPTIHHELGVLTNGFGLPPFFMLTYNSHYYDGLIQQCGYHTLKDFAAYKLDTADFQLTNKIHRVQLLLQKKCSVVIRTPNMKDFINELRIFHGIYNSAFVDHWGFSPINWDEFLFLGKDMKMVLNKEMVLIAEIDHEPIGFLLAIPNLNEVLIKIKNGRLFPFGFFRLLFQRKKIKSLRVITIAIKKEYQHLGIGSILYPEIVQRAKTNGYTSSELSWVSENNVQMNKVCIEIGGEVYKNYRLYSKPIS
jgi:GNAT superfamily N-acetyltransferase